MATYCILKRNKVNLIYRHHNMKVLLITDHHAPSSGGAENYFFDLKSRLKKRRGIQVSSLGFGPKEMHGSDYFVLKSARSNLAKLTWRLLFHPIVYFKLRKHIKKIQPDVIHLHNIKQYTLSLLMAVRGYPIVQTVHDFSNICPTAQNIHQDLTPCPTGLRSHCFWQHQVKHNRIVYLALSISFYWTRHLLKKTVSTFIAPSPFLVDYLQRNQFHPAVFIPPFKQETKSFSFETIKPHHFLFAGNLGAHKGVFILLEEFALACQKNPLLVLNIAGTGPEEGKMRERVKQLGIEKQIRFLGWQKCLSGLYAESIAVIFPSIGMESFGLIITEAMSEARPVIGVNRGTSAWLIEDQQTGLWFDPLKKGDLADKILELSNDREKAEHLGKNGYEKLKKLINNQESLDNILSVYKNAGPVKRQDLP